MVKDSWVASAPRKVAFEHVHEFTGNEPEEVRSNWAREVIARAKKSSIDLNIQKTADGFTFGFANFVDFARFYLDTYGDAPSHRGHKTSQLFPDGLDQEWIEAAEMYLRQFDIDYDIEVVGNKVIFSFDRFGDAAALRLMIDDQEIDRAADMLSKIKKLVGTPNMPGFEQKPHNAP